MAHHKKASNGEITAGTETAVRSFSPADLALAATTHGGSGTGDMTKAVYDPQNSNYISGADGVDAGAADGGIGGTLVLDGGDAAESIVFSGSDAPGGSSGSISLEGGNAVANNDGASDHAAAGGTGGNIFAKGGDADFDGVSAFTGGNAGNLIMNGGDALGGVAGVNAGNIDTTAGGNLTMGTGDLTGPSSNGTIALISDIPTGVPVVKSTSANNTSSSTNLANVTGLTASVLNGHTYAFIADGMFQTLTSTAEAMGVAMNGPAATGIEINTSIGTNGTGGILNIHSTAWESVVMSTTGPGTSAVLAATFTMIGRFTATADGTLAVRYRAETGATNSVTILPGALLQLFDIT